MNRNAIMALAYAGILALGAVIAYNVVHIPQQSEMVVLFVLLLLYPIFRFPLVGVYAVFIVSPLIPFIRRLFYLVHGRPGMDPLIMVSDILVAIVFVGLFFEFRARLREDETNGFYLKLIAFYLAYLVFRTFVLNECSAADAAARLKFYAPMVLLFYIGYLFAHRHNDIRRLWWITALVSIAACAYGLRQLYFGYSSAEKIWFSSISFTTLFIKGIARPFSFFQSPAGFADYLIIGIIAVLMLAGTGKARTRMLLLPALPVLFYGVLITSVRSSWIGAAAVFFFWYGFFRFRTIGQRAVAIVIVVIVFFSYQIVAEWIAGTFNLGSAFGVGQGGRDYLDMLVTARTGAITNPFGEYSLLSRLALWQMIFATSASPLMALFGRGLGALNADSLYFTYLAEFGYPGLVLICVIVIGFISRGTKAMAVLHDEGAVALVKAILVFDAVFALMNITGSHIHSFPGDAYFWFFNGVLMNARFLDAEPSGQEGAS
jgi:hypothetical protein